MKTETVEEFKARGGRINYLPKVEQSPGKEETSLKTKLLAENWPGGKIKKRKPNEHKNVLRG